VDRLLQLPAAVDLYSQQFAKNKLVKAHYRLMALFQLLAASDLYSKQLAGDKLVKAHNRLMAWFACTPTASASGCF